ncbi:basic salivary proline-rich protein 2-like [Calliphora vicina]|uniref:basic salivary proline-rich protein 2-like n=1 Tax=Calliphora vicina TaxID=7373 RepID=UPI00325A4598
MIIKLIHTQNSTTMKFIVTIAVVLALLALTKAQDDAIQSDESNQPESSNQSDQPEPSDQSESLPAPPSDNPRPPRPEGPPRPGRPDGRPLGHRFPRPQPNEEQQAENGNRARYPPSGPHRPPIFY